MAWTAPYTAVAGGVVAAADFNKFVRDNLLATEAALAQTPGSLFISTGVNALAERVPKGAFVPDSCTTTSTAYTGTLTGASGTTGPSVTVTTGTQAIVCVGGRIGGNTSATASIKMAWSVSGATTLAANDAWAAGGVQLSTGVVYTSRWYLATGLNPGSNTFAAAYAVSSGTGTYQYRSLHVIPL
jgi:hypothetical protein